MESWLYLSNTEIWHANFTAQGYQKPIFLILFFFTPHRCRRIHKTEWHMQHCGKGCIYLFTKLSLDGSVVLEKWPSTSLTPHPNHHNTNFQRFLISLALRRYEDIKRIICVDLDIYFGKSPSWCFDSWPDASFDWGHPVGVVAVTAESSGNECFISPQKDNNNSSVVGGNRQKRLNLSPSAEAKPNKIGSTQSLVGSSCRTSEILPNRLHPSLLRAQTIWIQHYSGCSSLKSWHCTLSVFLGGFISFSRTTQRFFRSQASHTPLPIIVPLLWQCEPVSTAHNYLAYPPKQCALFKGAVFGWCKGEGEQLILLIQWKYIMWEEVKTGKHLLSAMPSLRAKFRTWGTFSVQGKNMPRRR